jgi:hypothetical protein
LEPYPITFLQSRRDDNSIIVKVTNNESSILTSRQLKLQNYPSGNSMAVGECKQ